MTKKQKLELTWIGKNERPRLEPRILLEDPEKSYHAAERREGDIFDNILIHGDNLLALKALEQEFTGKVKCIYIDPPFNTGGAFEHYDDGLEHSIWLNLMHQRLKILHQLLAVDGGIVINLDDTEAAYCKVLLDEVFGRSNYITTIVVEAATASSFKTFNVGPTQVAQYLLMYAKDKTAFNYRQQYIPIYEIDLQHFSRFIENFDSPAEQWVFRSINDHILEELGFHGDTPNAKWAAAKKKLGSEEAKNIVRERALEFALENCDRVFETKTLQKPAKWLHDHLKRSTEIDNVIALDRDGLDKLYIYKGRQVYFLGKGVQLIDGERVLTQPVSNIWTDIPTNNLKDEGGVDFPSGKKPEFLIRRIIEMISPNRGDIVLDSFGGSGSTAAVSHKMGRRWILIELGDHAITHCAPRLRNVIDGTDSAGVTEAVGWKGGGGFRFYCLAKSLLAKDRFDNWVIAPDYNAAMLAEAVCKLMGFSYAPSQEPAEYWRHGHSTETDFIYVTTQSLTHDALKKLSDEVGPMRTLLVCCKAWSGNDQAFENLTVKKIPQTVLKKCEWGRDDYSLKIADLPAAEAQAAAIVAAEPPADPAQAVPAKRRGRLRKTEAATPSLFAALDDAEAGDV